jgi:hypothetical protein
VARREELDVRIADGTDSGSSGPCAARSPTRCSKPAGSLASEIEGTIELAERSGGGVSLNISPWLADLRIAEIRAARSRLWAVAQALRSAESPQPRGVALATLLVRDGRSPLYVRHGPRDVELAAEATLAALHDFVGEPRELMGAEVVVFGRRRAGARCATGIDGSADMMLVVSREDWSAPRWPARYSLVPAP